MDFEETPEEGAFRVEVRSWLDAHAQRRKAGEQSDHSYIPGDGSPEADAAHVGACKQWQRVLYEGGNVDLRVPYIGFDPNSQYSEAAGMSNYDALQFHITKHGAHGLTLSGSN